MINANLPPILHRFRDIAFDKFKKSPYFATPLGFNSTDGGFPWDDRHKIFCGCQRMAKVPNAVEILRKIWTAWVGRTSVTMDRWQQIANVNVSSRSLKTVIILTVLCSAERAFGLEILQSCPWSLTESKSAPAAPSQTGGGSGDVRRAGDLWLAAAAEAAAYQIFRQPAQRWVLDGQPKASEIPTSG